MGASFAVFVLVLAIACYTNVSTVEPPRRGRKGSMIDGSPRKSSLRESQRDSTRRSCRDSCRTSKAAQGVQV
eukprot:5252739-Prymnesium_polylepis.1